VLAPRHGFANCLNRAANHAPQKPTLHSRPQPPQKPPFRGFLRWCSAQFESRKLTDRDAGRASHANALRSASIQGLTIYGPRRSFSLLREAAGVQFDRQAEPGKLRVVA